MALPILARIFPWGVAANAAVQLAKLGVDYKLERDRLQKDRRTKDLEALEARLDAVELRFGKQVDILQELAQGLEKEMARLHRGLVTAWSIAGAASMLALAALLLALV